LLPGSFQFLLSSNREIDNGLAGGTAAAEGIGLAIVSRVAVHAEGASGIVAVLPVAGLRIERPLHLVHRKGRRDGQALQAFCGVLRERTAAQFR
jgi:DNA-binding transcriptional LysR family regulator